MIPNLQPSLDRIAEGPPPRLAPAATSDGLAVADAEHTTPIDAGMGAQAGRRSVAAGDRPRSAFAELMSSAERDEPAAIADERSVAAVETDEAGTPEQPAATPPFAPAFDLPTFLRVLPRSGSEVAVAAAREPGLADAVRRLSPATSASEARAVKAEDATVKLPSFLLGDPSERPSERPSGVVAPTMLPATSSPTPSSTPSLPVGQAAEQPVAAVGMVRREFRLRADTEAIDAGGASPRARLQTELALPAPGAAAPRALPKVEGSATAVPSTTTAPQRSKDASNRALTLARVEAMSPARPLPQASDLVTPRTLMAGADGGRSDRDGSDASSAMRQAQPLLDWTGASAAIAPSTDAPTASPALRQPVGTEAWQDELSAQLSLMAGEGERSEAVMKLAPEELGELEIRVEVRDGEAALQFGVANGEARQAVEAAQSKLRDLFASQGMNISEFRIFSNLGGDPRSSSQERGQARTGPETARGNESELKVAVRERRTSGILDLYA